MNSAVERAIGCIWERYPEPLSLSDIARSAILSRFHFSRIFKDATGVSPGRFLSAVRIYQAKRMLLNTQMKVTDISFAVGFNSLGSFTNHFTASVGLSPGRFRRVAGDIAFEHMASPLARPGLDGTVTGTVTIPEGFAWTRVYLGVFSDPIIQCRPVAASILDVSASVQQHSYRLVNVPNGVWFIHAVAVADTTEREPWTRRTLLVGSRRLGLLRPGMTVSGDISLRLRRPTDLPILLALPDLETRQHSAEVEMAGILGEETVPDLVLSRMVRARGVAAGKTVEPPPVRAKF
ncbi:MAG TPA: AraC family transcriptional regulator [Streptosporangiaceae bacterium]